MKKLFVFLVVGMFLLTCVSAYEFDNIKNYDKQTKTIDIRNSILGIPFLQLDTVAEIKLTTPLDFQVPRGYQKIAEFDLTYYIDDNGGLDLIELFDIKDSMKEINRQLDFKTKTIEEIVVDDYEAVCTDNKSGNGICTKNIIGNHIEEKIIWNDFNEKDLIKGEQITIGIFTDVQKGDKIEWIPTFYGVEIEEWAIWTEALSAGLKVYWKMENTSLSDEIDENNLFNNGTSFVAGLIGNAGDFEVTEDDSAMIRNLSGIATNSVGTLSMWINPESLTTVAQYLFYHQGAGGQDDRLYAGMDNDLSGLRIGWMDKFVTFNDTDWVGWHHIVLRWNATGGVDLWVNNSLKSTATGANIIAWDDENFTIGALSNESGNYDGLIDEFGIWGRRISDAEIEQLYNNGIGITYGLPGTPNVTLNSPIDNYNSTIANINFNCTASDDINLINVSLYIDGIINETNSSGINDSNYIFTRTLLDESYNWTCEATDNENQTTIESYRDLLIDTIYPNVDITYPLTTLDYGIVGNNETLNWTANDTNIESCWYDYNETNTTVTCNDNTTQFILVDGFTNITFYVNDSAGNENITFIDLDYKVLENNRTSNSSTYYTARESYTIDIIANSSLTAVSLFYNGTYLTTTKSGNIWSYSRDLPSAVVGTQNFSYRFTYGGDYINSTNSTQTVNGTIQFGLCNATLTNDFLNISFKDESNSSIINATIPTSTFEYYLGEGDVTKTYQLINNTENTNYTFCVMPTNRTLHVDPYVQYSNTGYPQRIWNPDVTDYNSTVTNQVLYLLESTDGIYVTFQVVNSADQVLTGVEVIAVREISGIDTEVGRGTTGGDGSVTLWLNPDFSHDFTFSKDGFETYETTFAPTQSGYTITLGGGSEVESSYFKGINFFITPTNISLVNDTVYSFGFRLTSNFWDLEEYGFNLRLINGTIIEGDTTITSGTQLSTNYNTTNQTKIFMDYWWKINSTYTNGTRQWVVYNTAQTQWSIKNFFTDLNAYMDSGLFGIDNFGRYLIAFIIVFLSIGIMSYKYGLTSPMVVTTSIFLIIFFLDVVVGLIPPLLTIGGGRQIEHMLTFASGIILAIFIFREVSR